jgi:hypothetical protein
LPFDPTTICGDVQVDVAASGARLLVVLKGNLLPQNNTHFENHSRLNRTGEFRRTDPLVILSAYHLIVTSLNEAISDAIIAIAVDDIVKILACQDV